MKPHKKARRRPRVNDEAKGPAYERSLQIGELLMVFGQRRRLSRSKYSPDECRRQGHR